LDSATEKISKNMSTSLSSISSVATALVTEPVVSQPAPVATPAPSTNNNELEAAENERRRRRLLGYI